MIEGKYKAEKRPPKEKKVRIKKVKVERPKREKPFFIKQTGRANGSLLMHLVKHLYDCGVSWEDCIAQIIPYGARLIYAVEEKYCRNIAFMVYYGKESPILALMTNLEHRKWSLEEILEECNWWNQVEEVKAALTMLTERRFIFENNGHYTMQERKEDI